MSYDSIPDRKKELLDAIKALDIVEHAMRSEIDVLDSLSNYRNRMTVAAAAKELGIPAKEIRGAMERGELRYIITPGTARKMVTPRDLKDWADRHWHGPAREDACRRLTSLAYA